jgi:5-methylcytosine-specific restriction endonuclease McrA
MIPHGIITWQNAIVLLFEEKIDVLESYEATAASAGNHYEGRDPIVVDIPAVVRLHKMDKDKMHKGGIKFSRRNVYARDHHRCCYCGKRKEPRELNYDHVLPRSKGGKTTWENIVTACLDCNERKDNRTPEQAGMRMLFKPHRPEKLDAQPCLVDIRRAPEIWLPYITSAAQSA